MWSAANDSGPICLNLGTGDCKDERGLGYRDSLPDPTHISFQFNAYEHLLWAWHALKCSGHKEGFDRVPAQNKADV